MSESYILLVEDSATQAVRLMEMMSDLGYTVIHKKNGKEALDYLQKNGDSNIPELIISDIEMPKMNGFELTRRIRETETFADKPVILVTSLDSRQDREKGIDVGADAYIVKSSFDQSNLLEVLKKLI